jgi:GNAT superfamily N-acetyltransferase
MSIKIRKANVKDAPAIAEILKSAAWAVYTTPSPHNSTAENIAREIKLCNADKSHSIYVAENADGALVGYVSAHWLPYLFLDGPEGYLSELFIDEACRGNGVGTKLLKAVESEARERGCSRLLLINSRKRESYQRSFYRKKGWKEREEAVNFVYNLK